MPEGMYGTRDAARYLGLSVAGLAWHIHHTKRIRPDQKVGKTLIFSRQTLDTFREQYPRRRKHVQ